MVAAAINVLFLWAQEIISNFDSEYTFFVKVDAEVTVVIKFQQVFTLIYLKYFIISLWIIAFISKWSAFLQLMILTFVQILMHMHKIKRHTYILLFSIDFYIQTVDKFAFQMTDCACTLIAVKMALMPHEAMKL